MCSLTRNDNWVVANTNSKFTLQLFSVGECVGNPPAGFVVASAGMGSNGGQRFVEIADCIRIPLFCRSEEDKRAGWRQGKAFGSLSHLNDGFMLAFAR